MYIIDNTADILEPSNIESPPCQPSVRNGSLEEVDKLLGCSKKVVIIGREEITQARDHHELA
jgi:hypothetical protein